jgi:hypothetical protein
MSTNLSGRFVAPIAAILLGLISTVLVPTAAQATEPATLRATVVLASGAPAKSVSVRVVYVTSNAEASTTNGPVAVTNASGAVTLAGVQPGDVTLAFGAPPGYFAQYLGGASVVADADVVHLTSGKTTTVRASLAASGSLAVTVKSTGGKAVAGVTLRAYAQNEVGDWVVRANGVTTSTGVATFAALAPGEYRVFAHSVSGTIPDSWSGGVQRLALATSIRVKSGSAARYTFALPTTGAATGTVDGTHDAITEPAVAGVLVQAFHLIGEPGAFTAAEPTEVRAVTNANGVWTLGNLEPGTYTVRFIPPSRSANGEALENAYERVFLGQSAEPLTADYFTVDAGETTDAGSHTLREGGVIYGFLASDSRGTIHYPNVPVFVSSVWDRFAALTPGDEAAVTGSDGGFTISGVQPGATSLCFGTYSASFAADARYDSSHAPMCISLGPIARGDSNWLANTVYSSQAMPTLVTAPTLPEGTRVGQTVTVSQPRYEEDNYAGYGRRTYTWLRDGKPISGEHTESYTLSGADYERDVTVRVTSRFTGKAPVSIEPASISPLAGLGASPTVDPAIIGTPATGQLLTAQRGTWNMPALTHQYEWIRDNGSVVVGTGVTYRPTFADVGSAIRLRVTSHRRGYEDGIAEAVSDDVAVGSLSLTRSPKVTSTSKTFRVSAGSWSVAGASFGYSWQRWDAAAESWVEAGTTASITRSLVGRAPVRGQVTARVAGYSPASITVVAQRGSAGSATGSTTIAASYPVGATATAPSPTWSADPDGDSTTVTYAWQYKSGSRWKPISGGSTNSLVMANSLVGKSIRVVLTAKTPDYSTAVLATKTATVVKGSALTASVAPSLSGSFRLGTSVTALPGTWAPATTRFAYRWEQSIDGSTWTVIAKQSTSKLTVTSSLVGKQLRARVTAHSAYNQDGVAYTPAQTILRGALRVTKPGSWSTMSGGWWAKAPVVSPSATTTKIEWTAYSTFTGSAYDSRSGSTATGLILSPNSYLVLTITQSKAGYDDAVTRWVVQSAVGLENSTTPTVSMLPLGYAKVGVSLTGTNGVWSTGSAPTDYAYQWQYFDGVEWSDLPGLTTLTAEMPPLAGERLVRLQVTASKYGYAPVVAISDSAGPVQLADQPTASTTPSWTGNLAVGGKLTGDSGSGWDVAGLTFHYLWTRDSDSAVLSTTPTYTLTAADLGKDLHFSVTATALGHQPRTYSHGISSVSYGYFTAVKKSVVYRSGSAYKVKLGTWSVAGATPEVSWWAYKREGGSDTIGTGLTSPNLTPYAGRRIAVMITARAAGYNDSTVETVVQQGSAPSYIGTILELSGTPIVGETISAAAVADITKWNQDAYVSVQWKRNGTPIHNERAVTYTLTASDVGSSISATVSLYPYGWATGSKTFVLPGTVTTPVAPEATVAPAISGTVAVGRTVSASLGTWNVRGLAYGYQWFAGDQAIVGETSSSYTITPGILGRTLSVRVSANKTHYPTGEAWADPVDVARGVAATAKSRPTVKSAKGNVTASIGTVTPGYTVTIQWYRNDTDHPIDGATGTSYAYTPEDSGATLIARFTATRTGYATAVFDGQWVVPVF